MTVDNNIGFYVDTDRFPSQAGERTSIEGALRIRRGVIGGHLILSNLIVGNEIDATDCRIEGGLYMQGEVANPESRQQPLSLSTHCQLLVLTNTTVGLDADLAGLDCRQTNCKAALDERLTATNIEANGRDAVAWLPSDTDRNRFPEGMAARGLTVKGRLQFGHMRAAASADGPGRIPGAVDLGGAEIRILEICGDVFPNGAKTDRPQVTPDLDFVGARVGLFQLSEPFPEQVDMTGLRVERWDGLSGNAYLKILRRMTPLDTAVYTAVEQSLRVEGKDGLADRVYIAMRRRLRCDSRTPWWRSAPRQLWQRFFEWPNVMLAGIGAMLGAQSAGFGALTANPTVAAAVGALSGLVLRPLTQVVRLLFEFFLDLTTGYWTAPMRLLWPIGLLLVLSFAIANAPQNYIPSDTQAAPQTSSAICASSPLVRGMNYAIPVIDWMLDSGDDNADKCRLKQAGATELGLPLLPLLARRQSDGNAPFEVNPHNSALIIKILGWLLWPMLLVGMSVRVRGRAKHPD